MDRSHTAAAETSVSESTFLELAIRQMMLTADCAAEIAQLASQRKTTVEKIAVEQGALSVVQVEILEALLHPHEVAPDYEILEVLGQGGLGVVFRACQERLGRVVALKTIRIDQASRQIAMQRFKQEAQLIARLQHPNVITAYDCGTHAGRLYLAMELVEGEDLEQWINRAGRLSETTAWHLARQAAAGLAHAAAREVVHRDIKPANLLITAPPDGFPLPSGVPLVKITDFGLALLYEDDQQQTRLTAAGSLMGTPHYMAPEQLGDSHVDQRADIYALGATVYHMLSGQAPFEGQTLGQILARKLKNETPALSELVPDISSGTVELVRRMMENEPERRVADYESLLHDIDSLLASRSADPSDVTPWAPSPPATKPAVPDLVNSMTETSTHKSLTPSVLAPAAKEQAAASANRSSTARRRWPAVVLSTLVVLLLGGLLVGAWHRFSRSAGPETRFVRSDSGWMQYFNKVGDGPLDPRFRTIVLGNWFPDIDVDGGNVLAGESAGEDAAICTIRLPQPPDHRLENYTARLAVDLRKARSVEVQFGAQQTTQDTPSWQGPHLAVRMTAESAELGRRDSPAVPLRSVAQTPRGKETRGADEPAPHEVVVERHGTHWIAKFDGREIGSLPVLGDEQLPEIRLIVTGGRALFYLYDIVELAAPTADPHS